MLDGVEFGNEVVALVRGYVEREIGPLKAANEALAARVAELESRPSPDKGEPGEKGEDGISPDPEAVLASLTGTVNELVDDAVSNAVAALPPAERGEKGEDGASIDPAIVSEMVAATVLKAVEALPAPKDGRGIKELLIDRDGQLVAAMDDGELKVLGPVVGKDGDRGADGRDGFDLASFDAQVAADDRTIEFKFIAGEEEHVASFKFPVVLDRGVYKAGEQYDAGDAVTWGGSLWIAQRSTEAKPDTPESGWRLAVKRGRDGKDAKKEG